MPTGASPLTALRLPTRVHGYNAVYSRPCKSACVSACPIASYFLVQRMLRTRLTSALGCRLPIVQTAMGWTGSAPQPLHEIGQRIGRHRDYQLACAWPDPTCLSPRSTFGSNRRRTRATTSQARLIRHPTNLGNDSTHVKTSDVRTRPPFLRSSSLHFKNEIDAKGRERPPHSGKFQKRIHSKNGQFLVAKPSIIPKSAFHNLCAASP